MSREPLRKGRKPDPGREKVDMTPSTEEMSWEAEIQVEVFPNSPDPHIPPEEWQKALEGEEGLEEMLLSVANADSAARKGRSRAPPVST